MPVAIRRIGLERSGGPLEPYTGVRWQWEDGTYLNNSGQASNANPYAHFAIDTMTNLGLWPPFYAYLAQDWAYDQVSAACALEAGLVCPSRCVMPGWLSASNGLSEDEQLHIDH
jgi:hypothetical protein